MSGDFQVKKSRRLRLAIRYTSLLLVLVIGPAITAGTAYAQSLDKILHFDIKAQRLDTALVAFGQQAHLQMMIASDPAMAQMRTEELHGNYIVRRALAILLKGSGYGFEQRARSIVIVGHRPEVSGQADMSRKRVKQGASAGESTMDPAETSTPPQRHVAMRRPAESPGLQEVIVTAQKYRQEAFDVPISLNVLSGEKLLQHGIANLSDLQYDVPGLYMDNTGTTHAVFLRGVGNQLGNGAMVGQYIDDADVTAETYYSGTQGYSGNDGGLYDLQRVEVLKGPQGTLYGDGSMGGVIRYITNKPVLDEFQLDADVTALFTENGEPSQRIESMLNAPLVDGTLGLRFAGMFEHDGGWVDEPAVNLKNINDGNLTDVRAEVLWRPTERFKLNVMQSVRRQASGLGEGEDAYGNITPNFSTSFIPHMDDRSNITNISLAYDFGGAQLLSSSTYLDGQENSHDLYPSTTILGTTTAVYLQPYIHVNNRDSSEELRIVNAGDGPWHWSAGGFYKHYRDAIYYPGEYVGAGAVPTTESSLSSALQFPGTNGRFSSTSWAGFVDTSYRFFERLTLGAGTRYFEDRQAQNSASLFGYLSPNSNRRTIPSTVATGTFTSTDPRFYVQYRVTPHISTYASASKGFRSGGFNTPPAPAYEPEVLWSYDLGAKIRFPQEKLRADVDLFDMNYSNYVSFTYVAPVYLDNNVGKGRIQGVDADLAWRPVDQWTLSVNTELLHSKFLTASPISGFAPGERLPFAPTYSFTASIERAFHLKDKMATAELYYYQISRVQYR
ncbi:MAG TPA: TonB-dependent receptor, partial [Terriglobales bacterium]|nr:TonB-dependent receptor [Terriglobales bacterium]